MAPLIGASGRLVQNMADSLTVPTATSFRDITVDVLDAQRRFLNSALAARGLKVSYTHLIGYAIVQAARAFTMMTHAFRDVDGKPYRVDPQGVHLGIAVDVQKRDGSHALVVPVIKRAEAMDFATFHAAYEALIQKARSNRLVPDDFTGGTITLTNPGTLGTIASVPRLMKGQASIIATGAIRQIGPAKVMTITSTYDHRVIQGAESGLFLQRLEALLQGEQGFYGAVLNSLGFAGEAMRAPPAATPVEPQIAESSVTLPGAPLASLDDLKHVAAAMALVKAIRSFGHLAARLDPLGLRASRRSRPRSGTARPDTREHGADPGRSAAHLCPGADVRRGLPRAAAHLLRHHRVRVRAPREPPGAPLAAPGDRSRRAPQAAHPRRAAPAARAS